MRIKMGSLLRGAQEAEGTAVIIDVFRAFTTAAVAFSRGARAIIMVAEVAEALELRRLGLGELCMGEVAGMRPEGFDFGNSPFELSQANVRGKTIIQSTRAGTVGVSAAANAERIYAASLVTAQATVKAILRDSPEVVSIVAMGAEARERADEDEQCALYIRNMLQGRQPDRDAVRKLVLVGAEAQKYGDPARPHFHPKDREVALQIDSIPFAITVAREDGLLVARRDSLED
jgi:2-phosphosulfolactate phosphatase